MNIIYIEECKKVINFNQVKKIDVDRRSDYYKEWYETRIYFNEKESVLLETHFKTKEEAEESIKEFFNKYFGKGEYFLEKVED